MTDWTKPIFEETSGKPAKFIGFSSQGAAVIEYCENLYFVNADSGIRQGNSSRKQLKFVNIRYVYQPFQSYCDIIDLIGTKIIHTAETRVYNILGVFINNNGWSIGISEGNLVTRYVTPSYLRNVFVFNDTKEPVGKKVEI